MGLTPSSASGDLAPSRATDAGSGTPAASGSFIGAVPFLGVVVSSLGGPLALAALYVPALVADVAGSAGWVALAGSALFALPLLVWVRYAGRVAGPGGLYDYVVAGGGRTVARVQAGLWLGSYILYLVYTTAAIVYATLPTVLPWIRPYQPALEIAIPIVLAAIMLAGRALTLAVLGLLAAGQLVLVAVLASVTIDHSAFADSVTVPAGSGEFASASGQVALLYICGSLPVFLGGEIRRRSSIRHGLVGGYLLVAVGVVAAVYPLAANPAFTHAAIPGMAVAQVFSGRALAVAVGVGVAVSTAGVMLVEYLATSRLLHALTGRPVRHTVAALAVVLVAGAPLTLISPERIYDDLLKPSLVMLWLSQLIVFAVYPRFARRLGRLRVADLALAIGASVLAGYGLYTTFHTAAT